MLQICLHILKNNAAASLVRFLHFILFFYFGAHSPRDKIPDVLFVFELLQSNELRQIITEMTAYRGVHCLPLAEHVLLE